MCLDPKAHQFHRHQNSRRRNHSILLSFLIDMIFVHILRVFLSGDNVQAAKIHHYIVGYEPLLFFNRMSLFSPPLTLCYFVCSWRIFAMTYLQIMKLYNFIALY